MSYDIQTHGDGRRQATVVPSEAVAEALFVFMGWLTTREECVSFGSSLNAGPAADLIGRFMKHNGLPQPREDWHRVGLLTHPEDER